jgi:short-subunit dehydrogenase
MNNQKVILVTGTSSGFGLLIAARLAARGHFVYATMRDLKKQSHLLDEVSNRNGQVIVRELDVTKPATIIDVIYEIKETHGHIDVVINNAGYGLGGFFEDLVDNEIRQQMEVNFFGVQNVCRHVLPLMRERKKGMIINISSVAGQSATPALGAYSASKWALEAFSESLYHEVRPFGVKVVIIEPGSFPTKIFSDNARYANNFDNPASPYFEKSKRIKSMIHKHINESTRNPEDVAVLVEKIIHTKNPNLRYVSDFKSWAEMIVRKNLPPQVYNYIYRKIVYANSKSSI